MSKLNYLIPFFFFIATSISFAQYKVINKGIGGNNTVNLLSRIDKDVLSEKPDLVILLAGTNDMVNSNKLISYSQFEENYQMLIDKLLSENIKVVVMNPLPVDTGYLFKRHDRKLFTEDLNVKIDKAGVIVKKLAKKNNLHFIDLNSVFKEQGSPNRDINSLIINQENFGKEDGIHPTKEGYSLIAKTVYSNLKKNRLLKKNKKIICFGDSITYGSFMEGAGTAEGDTYPAKLSILIN